MERASAHPEETAGAVEGGAFVWPPIPDAPLDAPATTAPSGTDSAPTRSGGGWARLRGVLREAESWWLAPTSLPLARRAEQTGWAPDDLGRYCNRCAQTVGFGEDDEFGCATCRSRRLVWSRAVRLGAYEGDLAGWIREVKFHGNASLAVDLGRALAGRLLASGLPTERVCVVPIPMSRRERLSRGADHARCIAEGVAKGLWAPLVIGLKRRHGPSQREMASATARERNVKRAFRLRGGVDLSGWTTVVVDDVMTTGATMRAASRAVWPRRHSERPAAIWAGVVAVTPEPGRNGNEGRGASGVNVV